MDSDEKSIRAGSFGSVAAAYAEHRPGYPHEAVQWLVGDRPATILELGAGTGKLTAVLCDLGHRVIATDPDPEMLSHVRRTAPQARVTMARAEDIPLPSASVDVVVAGQAWHWFDAEHAEPEIARVLRPGGTLGLLWNAGDVRVPWVRKVFAMVDAAPDEQGDDPFEGSDIFVLTEGRKVKHWQTFLKQTLAGYVASTSKAATMGERDRQALLADADVLYDSYGRGPDGLLMPWVTHCFRGRVAGLETYVEEPTVIDHPDDDDGLLIDFN
jgi:SAM-dependent methyltransferase